LCQVLVRRPNAHFVDTFIVCGALRCSCQGIVGLKFNSGLRNDSIT
jgi:hypothetical protein